MKHSLSLRIMACCVAGSLFAVSAIAQDANSPSGTGNYGSPGQPPAPGNVGLSPMSSRMHHTERLSQLMGASVKDEQGNTIGQINDFVVNPMSGRIQFAVISLNDQSGKLTAIPWQLVRPGAEPSTCTLMTSKDKLDSAQTFEASSWPDFNQPQTNQEIYSHFGVQPQGHMGWEHQGGTGNPGSSGWGTGGNQGNPNQGQRYPNQGNPSNP